MAGTFLVICDLRSTCIIRCSPFGRVGRRQRRSLAGDGVAAQDAKPARLPEELRQRVAYGEGSELKRRDAGHEPQPVSEAWTSSQHEPNGQHVERVIQLV